MLRRMSPLEDRELALRSRHTVTDRGVEDAIVSVRHGRIDAVTPASGATPTGVEDLGEAWLLPGVVDTHVHVNEPGRAEWEGFRTATRAAAAGGVTTIVDMPLNSVPATTSLDGLLRKREAASAVSAVHVEYWGGVVPGNARELPLLARAGVRGFKCFLVPSGVDEFPNVREADLREVMPIIAGLGLPLLVHAELPGPIDAMAGSVRGLDPRRHATWLASRPLAAEIDAIQLVIRLCRETGCRVHVVHLSAAAALPDLAEARDEFLPITVETCPHYLIFDAEQVPDGATTFKCAPPIRERANRDLLWAALASGDIDLVASDHSPCPPDLKRLERGDFFAAWGGIASLELGLSALWTEARARDVAMTDVVRWMCAHPARLAGLAHRKGRIEVGCDADLVVWDPDAEWTVDPERLQQRHRLTPYAGRAMRGRVERTYVAGRVVWPPAVAGTAAGASEASADRREPA
jgi:allantoinase